MSLDIKEFQKELAHQKVYDAWQYVDSLNEMLTYMNLSYQLLENVHKNRFDSLKTQESKILQEAIETGSVSVTESDLRCTNLKIADLDIDDSIFLRKTIVEFFHYARVSLDILFQIINAALFADESFDIMDRRLITKVNNKLGQSSSFAHLKNLLDINKNTQTFLYLQAFDNYIKHIKTVLVTVKTSFIIGSTDEFLIKEFIYDGISYPIVNALDKVKEVNDYVEQTTENILMEIKNQLPNCLDNSQRIQNITFKQVVKENAEPNVIEYISFFIDVQNDINELPSEIKVLPLLVKPNDEIYSFDFRIKKIFIKKKDSQEDGIIGYAELKNGLETNEFYRVFEVHSCGIDEYHKYIINFANEYPKLNLNYYAMEGTVIFYKD
ncbi:hypothetical protein K144313037_17470 [Clostridium tetani]|uniref:hypothetical protein n=1 Tax=Clostridium tetani TaxID=1513 RepID=UPI000D213BD0|nr:hypothetical protein [Clostridium tetani]AVP55270.1 hypothetical protein C3B72_08995 [Clostridium tetani]BDR70335.1 hypothetical protein K144313037_17470 [Clostridium tetani]BDR84409.1 hypothetical protein K254310026_18200 [Clostridium tetani]BEV19973.1 hypothetical protein K154301001_18280 [Clostridium tetani]